MSDFGGRYEARLSELDAVTQNGITYCSSQKSNVIDDEADLKRLGNSSLSWIPEVERPRREKLDMLKGYTKSGKCIIGTYDLLPATALLVGRSEDGELIYDGESQVIWDASETQRVNGQIFFVDETYNHVTENEVDWKAH